MHAYSIDGKHYSSKYSLMAALRKDPSLAARVLFDKREGEDDPGPDARVGEAVSGTELADILFGQRSSAGPVVIEPVRTDYLTDKGFAADVALFNELKRLGEALVAKPKKKAVKRK